MSSGNEGCECIDQTSVLASLTDRACTTPSGEPGVSLTLGGSCASYNYGSSSCLQHDFINDAKCQLDVTTNFVEPFCFQPFCYVDLDSCKRNSEEKIYKSDYFADEDLFYSYSTCNGTNYFADTIVASPSIVGNISVRSAIPDYQYPMLGKTFSNGSSTHVRGDEYFDDSIPFTGVYIDYIKKIVELSNGDIRNMTYTHTSKASIKEHQSSSFTAAVEDVENGLVDMAIGPFWITGQRLKMTTFTVPLVYDKTFLVAKKPSEKAGLSYEVQKVLEPFTYGLWGVLIAIIFVAAAFSVWFSDRERVAKKLRSRRVTQRNHSRKKTLREILKDRKGVYFRLLLDAVLEKGMFFFSAGIEQDLGASLPHKVLMFGFGFFILIAVSAYVANLAAFLTQSGLKVDINKMSQVIDDKIPICGHSALEEEIRKNWPDGKWVFPGGGFYEMFKAFERKECKVLAVGMEDTRMDRRIQAKMCELGLVYTDSLVTENPIAFPIKPQLASAFSYWMYQGGKSHDISLKSAKETWKVENQYKEMCEVELSKIDVEEVNDFARVSPSNMFLPIMVFVICTFIAVVLQLIHENERKKGHTSSFGRKSTLNLFEGMSKGSLEKLQKEADDDEWSLNQPSSTMKQDQLPGNRDGGIGSKSVQFGLSHGLDTTEDNFNDQGAPQSLKRHKPKSILRDSINDGIPTVNGVSEGVDGDENKIGNRIEQLVESGAMEEVLDCFDFFQEMKKMKKDQ